MNGLRTADRIAADGAETRQVWDPSARARLGEGERLDDTTRRFLEQRFGRDLASVRIHQGGGAAAATRRLGAAAYTVGDHIVFSAGAYRPDTATGLALIAHEVAHTIQQAHGARRREAGSLPPASSAQEQAAHRAARLAVAGPPAPGIAGRGLTPTGHRFLGRAWTAIPGGSIAGVPGQGAATVDEWESDRPDVARFKVPLFTLPQSKGPVLDHYQQAVQAGALQATVEFEGSTARAGLWQSRASTSDLHRRWLAKVGWAAEDANRLWHQAGGRNLARFPRRNPGVTGSGCDMDHIVELQLGGTNVPSNVAPLNSAENRESGRVIWQHVSGIARALRPRLPASGTVNVILAFQQVQQAGGALPRPSGCPAPGAATSCSHVDCCAASLGTAAGADAGTERYPIVAGAQEATFQVPPGNVPVVLLTGSVENRMAAEAVPGVVLSMLTRTNRAHELEGFVESQRYFKRSRTTRIPIVLSEAGANLAFRADPDGERRRLRLKENQPQARFTYPYLSSGTLRLRMGEAGLEGTGQLRPSLPLLSRARIDVRLANGAFEGRADIDPSRLRLGPLRATRSDVAIALAPEFAVTGGLGFEIGRLAEGEMTASADAAGFAAEGTVRARIPGLDDARGNIAYRQGRLTGEVLVGTSQLQSLPGNPRGEVRIGFDDQGVHPSGRIVVDLPTGQQVEMDVRRSDRGYLFTGRTRFEVPGLRPVDLTVRYDGEHFSARGTTGITYRNLTGEFTVQYRDGRFSGDGRARLEVGRAQGTVNLHLSRDADLYGDGQVRVRITDSLTGVIGVEKPRRRPLRVTGTLELPPSILLFRALGDSQRLFRYNVDIPIIGLSVGPKSFGLIGRITGEAGYRYSLGPGTIANARVTVGFNPLEADTDFELRAGAQLRIPAEVAFYLAIRAALGVSVAVASVTGGLTVRTDLGIRGGLDAPFDLHYRGGRFLATAEVRVVASPFLELSLTADIFAEALGEMFTKRWVWELARYRYGSSFEMALIMPLRYASDEPFRAPALRDIRFEGPDIDLDRMLPDLARAARR